MDQAQLFGVKWLGAAEVECLEARRLLHPSPTTHHHGVVAGARPVAVIAALDEEAQALVRRMPRSESVGPHVLIWEAGGLGVIVAGVGKVAAAIAAQYACDVFKPRCIIAIGLAGELESRARRGRVGVASGANQHDIDARPLTDVKGVMGFGADTAANLFESIIHAVVDEL